MEAAEPGRWVEDGRERLLSILVRALEGRAGVYLWNREYPLWVYERCRKLTSEELGVDPSPQTKEVHAEVLQSL